LFNLQGTALKLFAPANSSLILAHRFLFVKHFFQDFQIFLSALVVLRCALPALADSLHILARQLHFVKHYFSLF
ncbi:MAG: hypothetical protein IJA49_06630, partial [Oscillospiraceae bacterium]|nr:hypothetical protein [Oscillospiraceae bacterium]